MSIETRPLVVTAICLLPHVHRSRSCGYFLSCVLAVSSCPCPELTTPKPKSTGISLLLPQVKIWFQNRRSKYKKIMKQGGTPPIQPQCSQPNSHQGSAASPSQQQQQGSMGVKQQQASFLDDGPQGPDMHPGSQGSPNPQHGLQHPHPQGTPTPMLPASSPMSQQGSLLSWSDLGSTSSSGHAHSHSQHHAQHQINNAYMSHYSSWYAQSGLPHQHSLLT